MNPIIDFINANRDRYVAELKTYLAIPSIAGCKTEHAATSAVAEWTSGTDPIGLEKRPPRGDAGHPDRLRRVLARRAPDDAFYGHYEVQPSTRSNCWSPRRSRRLPRGEIYAAARPTTRARSSCTSSHRGALEAGGKLPIQRQVRAEGEEEVGTPTWTTSGEQGRARLRCRVISDSPMFEAASRRSVWPARPPYFQIDLRGRLRPALGIVRRGGRQSGVRAGPILAQAKDKSGHLKSRVLRQGPRTGSEERAEFASCPSRNQVPQGSRRAQLFGESGYTTLERVWARPTSR